MARSYAPLLFFLALGSGVRWRLRRPAAVESST
jgi:hypothetical protein